MLRVRNSNVSIGRGETGVLRVSAIRSDGTPYVLPPLPRDENFSKRKAFLRLGINTDTYESDNLIDSRCDLTNPMATQVILAVGEHATSFPAGTRVNNPGIVRFNGTDYKKGFACFGTEIIEDKKAELKAAKRFTPLTNCVLDLDGQKYNLNVLQMADLQLLLVRLNM